jgi:hypothetical protein
MTTPDPLALARATIAFALEALEQKTGQSVKSLNISKMDVTRIADSGRRTVREVQIEMHPKP